MLIHHLSHSLRSLMRVVPLLLFVVLPGIAFARAPDPPSTGSKDTATQKSEAQRPADTAGSSIFEEPGFVSKGVNLAETVFGDGTGKPKSGFYPEFSNMITGSGFVSVGPGYRLNFNGNKAFFDTSAAVSWHLYKMAQARVEFSQLANDHLTLGAQTMWQDNTQVSYFGMGPNAVKADQAQYRLQTVDFVGYAAVRPAEWLSIGGELGWLDSPRVLATAGTFDPNYPDARVKYAGDPGFGEAQQPTFVHSELSVTADTLDSHSHPTSGGLYRAAATKYVDQADGTYSFTQYEAQLEQMVPIVGRRVVLGLRGWTVFSDVANGRAVPFYLMPVLGGNNTLRGYDDYQFHDQNTVVATAELRLALLAHADIAAFYDAGNVATHYSDLNFDKTSVGGGLRLHVNRTTFARFDVAHGADGWRVIFRTTDPFKLSRVSRKLASVPFMP